MVILLQHFIQLQITFNGNKTVNIYVKKKSPANAKGNA